MDLMPVASFLLSVLQDVALSERISGPIQEMYEHEISVAAAYAEKVGASECVSVCSASFLLSLLDEPEPTTVFNCLNCSLNICQLLTDCSQAGLNGEKLTDALMSLMLQGMNRDDTVFTPPAFIQRARGAHASLSR